MTGKPSILDRRPHLIPCAIAAVMLLLAIRSWPYAYYQCLRVVVCAVAVFVVYKSMGWRISWPVFVFVPIAIMFNPLVPLHLSRPTWQGVDIAACAAFTVVSLLIEKPIRVGK